MKFSNTFVKLFSVKWGWTHLGFIADNLKQLFVEILEMSFYTTLSLLLCLSPLCPPLPWAIIVLLFPNHAISHALLS